MGMFSFNDKSSLFGINESSFDDDIKLSSDSQRELIENFLYEDAMRLLTEAERKEFCNSSEAAALIQEGAIGKNTIVRLSKEDDLSRRIKVVALQMAREDEDTLWDQLYKNRLREKELLAKIVKKFGPKASKEAVKAQKAYLKLNPLGGYIKKK